MPDPSLASLGAIPAFSVGDRRAIVTFVELRSAGDERGRSSWSGGGGGAAVRVAGVYAAMAAMAMALTLVFRDTLPWSHPRPWLALPPGVAIFVSSTLGLALASGVVFATRILVGRYAWARRLHAELRPAALGLPWGHIVLLAGLSSLGEELLFRGLLVPWIGVIPAALLFGLAHQTRGRSRWVWAGWAMVVGLLLGGIFNLTGSLVGPVLAHALINGVNLAFLRDNDFGDTERSPA